MKRLKQNFNDYLKDDGPIRTMVFFISGIVTFGVLAMVIGVGLRIGSNLKVVVGFIGLVVATLALVPAYFDTPSKDELVRLWKRKKLFAVRRMLKVVVMLALAFMSFVLAILSFN